jgi:hypothetical protein
MTGAIMAPRRKLIAVFIIFSFVALTLVYLTDENYLQSRVQPYKGFPSLWKDKIQIRDGVNTQPTALHLQDAFYGRGCQENLCQENLRPNIKEKWYCSMDLRLNFRPNSETV